LTALFHPDNIKIMHAKSGGKVSTSLYDYCHTMGGPKGVARGLKSDIKLGIEGSKDDIAKRTEKYGENRKRLPKIRTLFESILENFEDRILQILLLAATVALCNRHLSKWMGSWLG